MSKALDDFRALLEKVATGNASDPKTQQAVADLKAHLAENDATDAEQQTMLNELVTKLAAAPPTP